MCSRPAADWQGLYDLDQLSNQAPQDLEEDPKMKTKTSEYFFVPSVSGGKRIGITSRGSLGEGDARPKVTAAMRLCAGRIDRGVEVIEWPDQSLAGPESMEIPPPPTRAENSLAWSKLIPPSPIKSLPRHCRQSSK